MALVPAASVKITHSLIGHEWMKIRQPGAPRLIGPIEEDVVRIVGLDYS